VKARCDLVVGARKLVGSAQVQRRGFLLQQNSLPLRLRLEEWNCVFLRPNAAPAAVPLCEAAGREVTHAEVAEALRRGFGECFSADLGTGVPSQRESARAAKLAAPPL
jgi:lipoate-protein ligase A